MGGGTEEGGKRDGGRQGVISTVQNVLHAWCICVCIKPGVHEPPKECRTSIDML